MAQKKTTDNETALSTQKATEIVKRKRGANWMRELSGESDLAQPGDNSRFLRHALASWNLPPIDISDPKQVENRIGEYFQHCMDNDRRPQVVGLCNWLGINRNTLNEWLNGVTRKDTHGDIIKKAYSILEETWADLMLQNKVNPAAGCFMGKNWYQYADTQQIIVTPNDPMRDLNAQEARQRIVDAIPVDDDE